MPAFSDISTDDEDLTGLVEECLHLLISGVTDYSIVILNVKGEVISWNEGAQRIKGFKAEDIIGRHFSALYTPEDRELGKPQKSLAEASETGRFEDEGWCLRADGKRFRANIVLTALRDARGRLRGYAKITRDISESKQAEKSLRESEQRYKLLVSSVKDYAIIMLDDKGYITSWNEGAEQASGYTAGEIIGQHFSVLYTEEDRLAGKPDAELQIALAHGRCEDEGWRVRKDFSRFIANTVITSLVDPDGILCGFAKITRDITERKKALQDIAEIKLRLSLALESGEIGVWDLDLRSGIVWRSVRHDEILGIDSSIADWTVDSFLAHVVAEDRDEVQKAVDVTSDTGRFRATCRIVRGDGNLRWISAHGDVLRDDRGRARRVIGIISDITDRKEQEDRHRLMAIMQEREDFMATLTHDMKNPLLGANRVLQSVSSGQLGALTDQQSVLLDSLVDNNCNVLSLISNLIEVYRMEKEANVFLPTDVDLIALVSGALTQVKSIAALRDINFTTQLSTGSLLVRADSGAIVN